MGKDGLVEGDISTQDAVISGRVKGSLKADSRLEVQAASRVEGEISAGRMQVEEGAVLNGTVKIGKAVAETAAPLAKPGTEPPK